MQLARQVHSIPAAAMALIFPLASRKKESGTTDSVARLRNLSVLSTGLITTFLGTVMAIFGPTILALWMGEDFLAKTGNLLLWLVLPFFLLSLSIAPYYLLLGFGEARFVSINSIVSGTIGVLAAMVLIPRADLIGAALSRTFYAMTAMLTYVKLYHAGVVPHFLSKEVS
jgi:O-antigen/teichoic acid export membrane protein